MTRARELRAAIRELPSDGEWDLTDLKSALKSGLGLDRVGFFRPQGSGDDDGIIIEVDMMDEFEGLDLSTWRAGVSRGDGLFFDPTGLEKDQRNEVVSILGRFGGKGRRQDFFRRIGLDFEVDDITRVIVCDGDELLMWVGGASLGPLDGERLRAFASVVPDLGARFVMEKKLRDGALAKHGLATALELLSAPAFIVRRDGVSEHANGLGKRLHDRDGKDIARALTDAVAAFEDGRPAAERTQVTRLAGVGVPRWLVILHERAVAARVASAADDWGLTDRQRDVLGGIVSGHANKAIAKRLKCSEATVEAHATAIYRKARVEGRAALIAKFLAP